VDHRTDEPVGENRQAQISAGISRQPAPKPAGGEFHHRARSCRGLEEFNGEMAKLQCTAEAAAIAMGSLGRFRRYAVNHAATG
jgi:hypothetical protein